MIMGTITVPPPLLEELLELLELLLDEELELEDELELLDELLLEELDELLEEELLDELLTTVTVMTAPLLVTEPAEFVTTTV